MLACSPCTHALLAKAPRFTQNLRKLGGGVMGIFGSGHVRVAYALVALSSASLLPATAGAYTPEQQQACTGGAFRLCSSDIPDVDRITACMVRNKAQLSPECRAQFRAPPGAAAMSCDPLERPLTIKPAAACKAAGGKPHKAKKPARHGAT
jgi:hypothetical protein